MSRINEENKREKVLITLPDNYLTAIDNKIDNVLIRTRGDAIISLLSDLQKLNPKAIEFDEMIYIKSSEFTELKNRLAHIITSQSKQNIVIERVSKWYEDDVLALEGAILELALDSIEAKLNAWARVGNEGLAELRRIGYFKKKETDQGAQVQP